MHNVWNNDENSTETGVPIVNGVGNSGDPNLMGLNAVVDNVSSADSAVRLQAVKSVIGLSMMRLGYPVEEVKAKLIQAGILPKLVDCLNYNDPSLQRHALKALGLIGCGPPERVRAIVQAGAVPHFLDLLCSPHSRVRREASTTISRTVWRGPDMGEYDREFDILTSFSNLIAADPPLKILRQICWTIVNLCGQLRDTSRLLVARKLVPVLQQLLQETDDETLTAAVWATSSFLSENVSSVEVTVITGLIFHLYPLLSNSNPEVQALVLRSFAKIVEGSDQHTQTILEMGILNEFPRLLTSQDLNFLREGLRFLSGITSEKQRYVQALLNHDLVPLIILQLDEPDPWAKGEALSVVTNLALYGSAEQVRYLAESGVIPPLCRILSEAFDVYLKLALQCISSILTHAGKRLEEMRMQLEGCGGIATLEILQEHEDMAIFRLVYHILEQFFG